MVGQKTEECENFVWIIFESGVLCSLASSPSSVRFAPISAVRAHDMIQRHGLKFSEKGRNHLKTCCDNDNFLVWCVVLPGSGPAALPLVLAS